MTVRLLDPPGSQLARSPPSLRTWTGREAPENSQPQAEIWTCTSELELQLQWPLGGVNLLGFSPQRVSFYSLHICFILNVNGKLGVGAYRRRSSQHLIAFQMPGCTGRFYRNYFVTWALDLPNLLPILPVNWSFHVCPDALNTASEDPQRFESS